MSPGSIRVRVRSASGEAEVEADPEHIREAIELIPEVLEKIPEAPAAVRQAASGSSVALEAHAEQEASGPASIPTITIEKNDSLTEIISKFFSDAWGKDRRKLSDVRSSLESYGLNYPKQSVAVALLRLTKTSRIRRFKAEDGEFVYTASTALMQPQDVRQLHQGEEQVIAANV